MVVDPGAPDDHEVENNYAGEFDENGNPLGTNGNASRALWRLRASRWCVMMLCWERR